MIAFDLPFLIICMTSIPTMVCSAVSKDLKPNIGLMTFFINR